MGVIDGLQYGNPQRLERAFLPSKKGALLIPSITRSLERSALPSLAVDFRVPRILSTVEGTCV